MRTETAMDPSSRLTPWGQILLGCCVPVGVMVAFLSFAPVLPLIRDDLDLNNTWAGLLASATIFTHALLQFPGAMVADRVGSRRAMAGGLTLAAIGMVASSLAPNIGVLLASRMVVGVGTSVAFITGLAFVNEVSPPRGRPVAQGLYGAASNLGVLLVMVVSGPLAAVVGWRGSFALEAVLLLSIAVTVLMRMRPDVEFSHQASASWGEVFQHKHLYLLGLAHVMTYGAFTGLSSWAATFLWEMHGIGLEWAGVLAAFLPASAVLSRTLGARLSTGRERSAILLSCVVATAAIAVLALLPDTAPVLVDLALVGWFASMPFGAIFSYASIIGGVRSSGRDLTVVNFIGNLGALLFPPAIGFALDRTGSFVAGFGIVAAVGAIGCATLILRLPRQK